MKQNKSYIMNSKGFSLLELMLVITLICILVAVMLIIIEPYFKELASVRNAKRKVDIESIITAVYQYSIDHEGHFPVTISSKQTEICKGSGFDCFQMIDLSALIQNEAYLVMLPEDPQNHSKNGIGYEIYLSSPIRITVKAPLAERGKTIEVSK